MNLSPGARARVVVIDDEIVLADVIRELLSDEGFEVIVQARWQHAHAVIAGYQPNVVLLDLRLGDAEYGWQILDNLRLDPATQHIPVVLWSAAVQSLRACASDRLRDQATFLLPKPFDLDQLLETVDEALALHGIGMPAEPSCDRLAKGAPAPWVRLTRREQEVVILLTRGYSNRQIADELVITPGTVANHVAHIFEKLECSSRTQVAVWAVAHGLGEPVLGATG